MVTSCLSYLRTSPSLAIARRRLLLPLVALLALAPAPRARAEKIWMSAGDGFWKDGTNWSGHTAPDITAFIKITNDITKTITIDGGTPATNLTVQKLTLSAPPGVINTVLLSSLGLTNPLVFQTGLELLDGAAIRITNSALQTLLTNDHVNLDGSLTLDSGSIDFGDITVTARVGRVTSGTFTINGGSVSAGVVTVGGLTNSSGFLNVNGGVLNIASLLSIGRDPGTTGTVAVLGGQVSVPNDDTRVGDSGLGFLTVSNAAVSLNNLQVGRDNVGTLSLQPGGLIQVSFDAVIGRFAGSSGSISISGGQLLCNTQRVFVGRAGNGQLGLSSGLLRAASLLVAGDGTNSIGGSGSVTLTGGSLILSSTLVAGSVSYSTGQVSIAGGELIVSNPAGTAVVSPNSGSIVMDGGAMTTDNLLVTNLNGQFVLHSGTLDTKNTTVTSGGAFVVGDGVSPAVLNLHGGTHLFANGLIISSNAMLSGCGTLIGTVINHGTISTNCGGTFPRVALTVQSSSPPQVMSFPSVTGAIYTLQYKNLLSDPNWTDLLPSTNGTGNPIILSDTTATGPSRFYRLKIQ